MLLGNYYTQDVWFYENSDFHNGSNFGNNFIGSGLINTGKVIQYPIKKQEPLMLELSNFIESIKGEQDILVKPDEALLAYDTCSVLVLRKDGYAFCHLFPGSESQEGLGSARRTLGPIQEGRVAVSSG